MGRTLALSGIELERGRLDLVAFGRKAEYANQDSPKALGQGALHILFS